MEQQVQIEQALNNIQKLIDNIENVIRGKRPQIQFILTALLAKGHVLMEDNPGTGKNRNGKNACTKHCREKCRQRKFLSAYSLRQIYCLWTLLARTFLMT